MTCSLSCELIFAFGQVGELRVGRCTGVARFAGTKLAGNRLHLVALQVCEALMLGVRVDLLIRKQVERRLAADLKWISEELSARVRQQVY